MTEESTTSLTDPYAIRSAFGRWLRIKIEHEANLESRYSYLLKSGDVKKVFSQLAADIEHSALLIHLLEGKEPLPKPPPLEYGSPVYPKSA